MAAFVARYAAKSLAAGVCREGAKLVTGYIKRAIGENMKQVCDPNFPTLLMNKVEERLKQTTSIPEPVRNAILEHRDMITSFATELAREPGVKNACSSGNQLEVMRIIDQKSVKFENEICAKIGGRRKRRSTRRHRTRGTRRRLNRR